MIVFDNTSKVYVHGKLNFVPWHAVPLIEVMLWDVLQI